MRDRPDAKVRALGAYNERIGFRVTGRNPVSAGRRRITGTVDLQRLYAEAGHLRRRSDRRPLSVELPALSPIERERWTRALNRYHLDCGCHQGVLTLLLGVMVLVGWVAVCGLAAIGWLHVVAAPVLLALLAGAGKLAGVAASRIRLRRLTRRLLQADRAHGEPVLPVKAGRGTGGKQ